jgi:hypothetical protein
MSLSLVFRDAELAAGWLGGEFAPCDETASALFDRAVELNALSRDGHALAVYRELIARLADPSEPAVPNTTNGGS